MIVEDQFHKGSPNRKVNIGIVKLVIDKHTSFRYAPPSGTYVCSI